MRAGVFRRDTAAAPARHRPGARPARRGGVFHWTADLATEQAMKPVVTRATKNPARRDRGRTVRRCGRPTLEALEDRTVPATISVADASLSEIGNVSTLIAPGSGGLNAPSGLVQGPDGN